MKRTKRRIHKGGALLLTMACILSLLLTSCGKSSDDDSSVGTISGAGDTSLLEAQDESTALQFPYQLEDGKLEVTSLFQFTGFNPDCNGEEGEDIASLSFTNTSEEYLTSAAFTAVLADGTQFHFEATDVPAGASVLAFATDNAAYDAATVCESITCDAVFEDTAPLMEEAISISVEETTVTLTNLTGENLTNLVIHCHTLFDGDYFGGLTYSYPVELVEAGSSVTLQAEDCYLGEAAVVQITQGN